MSCKCNIGTSVENNSTDVKQDDWKRRYNWWYYKDMLRECPDYKDRIANATEYSKRDKEELYGKEA